MATFNKLPLSGSVGGVPILISSVESPGTLFHTATPSINSMDEVWLWVITQSPNSSLLTVELGGVDQKDRLRLWVPANSGMTLIVPGLPFNGEVSIRGFTDQTDVLSVVGYVNRINQ